MFVGVLWVSCVSCARAACALLACVDCRYARSVSTALPARHCTSLAKNPVPRGPFPPAPPLSPRPPAPFYPVHPWLLRPSTVRFLATARQEITRKRPLGGASGGAGGCGRPAHERQLVRALLQLLCRLLLSRWGATPPGRGQLGDSHHDDLLVLQVEFLEQVDSADRSKTCERHDSERRAGQLESAFIRSNARIVCKAGTQGSQDV